MNRSMLSLRRLLAPFVATLLLLAGAAVAQQDPGSDTEPAPAPTLADVIRDHPDLAVLYEILSASNVLEQLEDPGQLTVFAPTDAAFEALGEEQLNALVADPEIVNFVLRYHVVGGTAPGEALERLPVLTSLQGGELLIESDEGGTWIDGARLVEADLQASNGVVHVIDAVLEPTGIFPLKNQSTIPEGDETGGPGDE